MHLTQSFNLNRREAEVGVVVIASLQELRLKTNRLYISRMKEQAKTIKTFPREEAGLTMADEEEFTDLKEEYEKFKDEFESGGLAAVASKIKSHLEDMDNVQLNIAITGESGSGKSTFVNCIRGLGDEEKESAKTGVVEETMVPTMYPCPKNPNVRFWDLPGIGTPSFQADQYLEKVEFNKYDFFIIIASMRFKENDITLAQAVQKMGKKFYFVRSMIDRDIDAASKRRKNNFNEKKILEEIRQNCVDCLQKLEGGSPSVFLISFEPLLYDFQKLEETLEKELPKHKRDAFLQALPNISLQISKRKRKALRARIWKLAALSCGIAIVPIPGLSVVCDVAILVRELRLYYNTFGLDDESLQSLAKKVGKPVEDLKSVIKSPLAKEISSDVVLKLLTKAAGGGLMVVEYWASTIPIFGSIAAGGISFGTTYYMLKSCLEELAEDAQNVLTKAVATEV